MAGISATGIGSGLDLQGLVSQLVAAERAPIENRLNRQESTLQAKISAYGSLRGSLSTIESPLKRLSEFEPKMSVTNSNKEALSVTAADDAPAGNFSITVNQLATAQSLATNAADAGALFSGGAATEVVTLGDTATFSIQVGSGDTTDITLDASEQALTLGNLRDAINDADAGVTASIINDSNGARLVMTANDTGESNTITTTATGMASGALDTALSLDGSAGNVPGVNGQITQVAQDAQAIVNGITINSDSNTLGNAVDGLSITLLETTTSATSVRVAEDRSSLRSLLNEFIGGYNELIKQTNSLTAYDAENDSGAVLTGDATVRGVRTMLGNAMVSSGQAIQDNGSRSKGESIALANLGIVSSATGTLSFDQSTFDVAIEDYGMENITAALKDIAGNFHENVTGFTSSTDGMLAARTKGLNASIADIGEQREQLDKRTLAFEARMTAQFNAMDSLVAEMNTTGNYLMSQLGNLMSNNNNSN
ncbi:flagellar filament capping protein FliD [Rhabdochromatium marinum]|uniref:flagellar filament capping protein FliD n=1 Tax=Rhabdochromatium marinum TaxID=48729 RepID=UPI00190630DC|nr:flagellar filament capping protein FliD [Rhabdochromatium marinum]MBK1647609.1 hypothetical protein [Rhabdochromatium marinum]